MTRDDYRTSLTAMTDSELVKQAIADYLLARRSSGRDKYVLVGLAISEFIDREGNNGPLWLRVLAEVRAEEEKVREGNRLALERLPKHAKE